MKKTIKTLALITVTIGVATVIKRVQIKNSIFRSSKASLNNLNRLTIKRLI